MPLYQYEVVDSSGNISTGQLNEDNQQAALRKLQEMGYTVSDMKEVKTVSSIFNRLKFERRVKIEELTLFSRQLSAMLNAGIPLTRALFTLSEQIENPSLNRTVSNIAENVEAGMSFSEALDNHPSVFSNLYVNMVEAGEEAGTLEQSLARLSDQLEKDKALRDNIRSATFYPVLVSAFAVLILVVMMVFIVPIFVGMFPADVALPLPTRVLIAISDSIRDFWYLWIIVIGGIVWLIKYFLSTPRGEHLWSKFKLSMPVFGPLVQKAMVARFTRTLATMLSGGISVLRAIENSGKTSGNVIVEEAANDASNKIQEGMSIARPLQESGLFPPMVIQMISVGEETGALSDLLNRVANFYEEEVETMTRGLTALVEPLMLVGVGLIIGAIVIALYLPIFMGITQMA